MVNQNVLEKTDALLQKYKERWGRDVCLNYLPPEMTQEKLVVVLERIVETGESVLVGWNKLP